jgi:hypothetical protein
VFTYKKSYQVIYGSAHFEIHVAKAIGIPRKHGAESVTSDQNGNVYVASQDGIFLTCPASNECYAIDN